MPDDLTKSKKVGVRRFAGCSKILNFGVFNCFNEVKHSKIFELAPLCSKYQYFLKSWCRAGVVGKQNSDDQQETL